MVRKKRAASSDFPLESNAVTLAVTAPALRFPASVDEDGVGRYAASRDYSFIIPHTRAEVAEKGEKYGDDTHPQARKNMVILV